VTPPPFATVGGVGSSYGVKRVPEASESFPPAFLTDTIENIKKYSERYGTHLERYAGMVREFLEADCKDWESYQARVTGLEVELFNPCSN